MSSVTDEESSESEEEDRSTGATAANPTIQSTKDGKFDISLPAQHLVCARCLSSYSPECWEKL